MRFMTRTRLRWLTRRSARVLPATGKQAPRAVPCSIVVKAPAWLSPNQPGMARPTAPVRKQRPIAGVRVRRFVK